MKPLASGDTGGQLAAASSLMNSPLVDLVDVIPMSTTMRSSPPPSLVERLGSAAHRLATFTLLLPSADVALIFASNGLSAVEKGLMGVIASAFGRGAVLRFSSGAIADECERSFLMRWWMGRVVERCHAIVAQGPFWVSFFEAFPGGRGKVVEILNAIPMVDRERLARRGAPGKRIVYVGWIYRPKGVFDALDALEKVLRRVPDATLTLIGGGRDEAELRAAAAQKGIEAHVDCKGWLPREEVFEHLLRSDVFFLPSHAEGLPNAMLEAMSAALPVVATRVGAIQDVVTPGRTGFVTAVGDTDAMADALCTLLEDPALARSMGEAGHRQIEQNHSIDVVWPRYAALLGRAARAAGRDDATVELPEVVSAG
ncbi:glycosyltransferase family 4 protein [Sorangium cellulosum]|uniref:glycosyltransferase family 4 protein n=1 Tax=Sorangium cellulosum TaxID=56 RepID=UPI001331A41F|nr:glycosyltransferase family 4 protein [Sorangium cellulosum]